MIDAMERVDSGIQGFDKLLNGGLPKGRAYLISGEPGTGKTIFSLQYLMHGVSLGEKCVYISIDEKPEHIIEDAESLGWEIKPHLKSGKLQIIDVTHYFSSTNKHENDIDINKVLDHILDHVKQQHIQRLAIDPVAPLIFLDKSFPNAVEYIRRLIFSLENSTGCTTLLTSYVPVGSNKVSSLGVEEFACSGIITVKLVHANNKRIRTIGVRKMRGSRIDLTEYSFEILPNRGVVLRQPT